MTGADAPSGYSGETATAPDPSARVYEMRDADQTAAYLWVQNRNNTWYKADVGTAPSPINPTVTIGNLLNHPYWVDVWNPYTGTILSSSQTTSGRWHPIGVNLKPYQ